MQQERFSLCAENRGGVPRHAAPRRLGSAVRILLASHLCLLVGSITQATTWTVDWDPDDTIHRIGRTVEQSSSGDSIVIGPGVYFEHILIDGKSLTFVGRDGPGATVLDGSIAIEGRQGSIIYNSVPYHGEIRIVGLTFRNGTGSRGHFGMLGGGALHIWNTGYSPEASFHVEDCVFESNHAKEGVEGVGGAIAAMDNMSVVIRNSIFRENYAYREGGALWTIALGHALVEDCEFELVTDVWGLGSAILHYGRQIVIQRCRFTSNGAGIMVGDGCIASSATSTTVRDCTFLATNGRDACRILIAEPIGWGEGTVDITFERNRLWTDAPTPPDEETTVILAAAVEYGTNRIADNVFVGCSVYAGHMWGATLVVERNCFLRGRVRLCCNGGGSASCNVSWPSPMEDLCHTLVWDRNVVADPLFCSEGPEEYGVASTSPCLPENSNSCGRIGQLEPGCEGTHIVPTTWGRIKHSYGPR